MKNKAITGIMAMAIMLSLGVGMVGNAEAQTEESFFGAGELCGYALGAVYDLACLPLCACSIPLVLLSHIPVIDAILHLAISFDIGLISGMTRITKPYVLGRYLGLIFEGLVV